MRLKFKRWIQLGEIGKKILEKAKAKKFVELADAIVEYTSFATGEELQDTVWYEIAFKHYEVQKDNEIKLEVPLVFNSVDTKADEPWDYVGRSWYAWASMFSNAYGWTLEYIAEMDVDDAIALAQEILVREQLEREWSWSLSEVAYPYDKSSKTSKFQPLTRPMWMKKPKPVKTQIKLPKTWIPAGIVLMGTPDESIKPS